MSFHFHFITLFPEVTELWMNTSILGRARRDGLFQVSSYQLRDFSTDKHHTVDDVAYGGGGGMVLKVEPLVRALEHIQSKVEGPLHTIYFSPKGKKLSQPLIESYAKSTHRNLVLVCGHYEGVDERFIEGWVDEEISLGDFVLTGGELPALAFTDSLCRQIDKVLGYPEAPEEESFGKQAEGRLLEHPHYTRPAIFRNAQVPEILLSGDHEKVALWRKTQALASTTTRRPDLLDSLNQNNSKLTD